MKNIFCLFLVCLLQTGVAQTKIDPSAIDIVRDSFGVPHIFAKTDREVAYGLAWAEAEDDFKSMQQVLLPTKGLTLPLLSFGGSAIAATCVAIAILLRVDWEGRQLARGFKV